MRYITILLLLLASCAKGPQKVTEVYKNDFETNDLTSILGGIISLYEQGKTLGRYNTGSFSLELKDLPSHDMVQVSFDLYIHDSWDGNDQNVGGPDIWQMKVNGDLFIHTTFSNCKTGFCLPQSYPLNYLNNKNPPGSGATHSDLPGVCQMQGKAGGTSLYKIVKTISHSNTIFSLQCLDMLKQTNSGDRVCDESWSVDNITVKVIKLN